MDSEDYQTNFHENRRMKMDAVKIVNKINKEHGTIKNVYFLACGGSLVDLYPGYYFVRAESAVMDAQWIPAREFALTPPKKLGKDSLLIICSHSGKTKECLEAAKTGMDAGAAVVTMTHAPGSPCDTDKWISVVYDWAPGVKEAEKPQGIVLRILNELMKVQEPGYKLYDKIVEGFEKIDDVIATAVKDQQNAAWLFAEKYSEEPNLYIMASGASYSQAYGFAICSLQEMQWMDCGYLNSAEYFHGPFEVTDEDHLYILMMSRGSVIGKTGLETLYEKELKGTDGCEICIVDANGNKKSVIAYEPRKDGEDIHITIDGDLQSTLYEQFKEDRGCSVALNPYTGEVLALVSTPSYDNNDFVRGMDNSQWSALNENEDRPLYNRFRQTWCPGSTFKPVIAAIGLKVGAFTANDDFGNEGLAWQKDSSWGDYTVTTLHDYEPVILKNALIYSDNIYFAKAALKIGADQLMQSLNQIGFNQELPFDIKMSESQYSNMDKIETEIQLADSGYGQGQILVNPLHLASIYTAFLNDGNMIKPYLHADGGSTSSEIWIKDAFSPQIVSEVMEGLEGVVNNPEGTGYGACREDIRLAGKTGTAELKDTSGTEIGWFTVFTTDRDTKNPILLISMVENVKDIGGSGYVVEKDKAILDEYLGNE